MGLLKVLNLGLDSAAVKIGSQHSAFLIVSCLIFFRFFFFVLATFYVHNSSETDMSFVHLIFQSDLLTSTTKLLCQHSGTHILCTWDIIRVALF